MCMLISNNLKFIKTWRPQTIDVEEGVMEVIDPPLPPRAGETGDIVSIVFYFIVAATRGFTLMQFY